jgi:hypothetical protein
MREYTCHYGCPQTFGSLKAKRKHEKYHRTGVRGKVTYGDPK